MPQELNLDEILRVAVEGALLAGAEIRACLRPTPSDNDDTSASAATRTTTTATKIKSDTTDLVTETDEKCEAMITELLQSKFPTHRIIGEESSGADCQYELTDEPTWTIDPIGTFIRGVCVYACNSMFRENYV